jgi:hypothetical protein
MQACPEPRNDGIIRADFGGANGHFREQLNVTVSACSGMLTA